MSMFIRCLSQVFEVLAKAILENVRPISLAVAVYEV